jgi:transcriptional regulator GlxA family with amidase domain
LLRHYVGDHQNLVLAAIGPTAHDAVVHDVTFVVYDGFQSLDLSGPLEVFDIATRLVGDGDGYRLRVVGPTSAGVVSSSGLRLAVDGGLDHRPAPRCATLVVVGGLGWRGAARDAALIAGLDRHATRADRVASVCTGALLLAATGRLDGRRAATHWANCAELADRHPLVDVDPDAIYVRDGDLWTSAGVTAGIDLALALVTEDHGPDVAHAVAGWLVMYVQRGGGQSQFSPQLTPSTQLDPLRDLQGWIVENLDGDLSVAALARHASMSERHLTRLFSAELGTGPAWHQGIARA